MNILVLTQQGGILKPFAILLGYIMDFIYRFLENFGIANVALTIVLLTVVVNICLIPITYKQQKFSRMSAVMNPELQKIRKKYANKKDENSMRLMQAETSAVYDKYGASPMGGCLPSIIQIPILFALYRVIYNVPAYVSPVKSVYEKIAAPIMAADSDGSIMTGLIKDLGLKVSKFDIGNIDKVIDALNLVKTTGWSSVSEAFSSHADVVSAISKYSSNIVSMNWLPGGLSVSDTPIIFSGGLAGWFPGVLVPILAGLTQWLNLKVNQRYQTQMSGNDDNPMTSQMKTMNNIMPLMSVFFCTTLPAGMGVYWISSAAIRTVISLIIDKFLKRTDIEQIIEANKEKAKKKAEKRGLRDKKLEEYASMSTSSIKNKSISSIAGSSVSHEEIKRTGGASQTQKNEASAGDAKTSQGAVNTNEKTADSGKGNKRRKKSGSSSKKTAGGKSISDIANMLENKNGRK